MKHPLLTTSRVRRPPTLAKCGACGLLKGCRSPKMSVSGKGARKILIVGEAPGSLEDQQNRPFVGPVGQLLENTLRRIGVEMRRDCWLTNALICRPRSNVIEKEVMIDHCRANVFNTIANVKPETILLLGARAVRSVIGYLWEKNPGSMTRWAGWRIPSVELNAWVCPVFHPSYLLHQKDAKVATLLFERHLESAMKLDGRPFDSQPDYERTIEVICEPSKAAQIVRKMIERGGTVAFDYETEGLKPEGGLQIVCCSVCWRGRKTVCYPWAGEAVAATKELLRSPLKKIMSNAKFEARWSLHHLKCEVSNIAWDTMVTAHLLDNREEVSGLKFQAFVRLGVGVYDDRVRPYLVADHASAKNHVRQCDQTELMKYCALDSLYEYLVAHKQAEELGVTI